jgi:MoxR-like ATPase
MTSFQEKFDRLHHTISSILVGKPEVVRQALICFFAGGHLLIEDVPGVGKTSLARAIAGAIDATWSRIQFTPDLLPSDVTGVTIYNQSEHRFEFHKGGIFSNIVIADEINRASPKTQSALLEVMEERRVTVDAKPYDVPRPFIVVATQNPVEMEGTYRLPEAQLDRFLMRISIGYPAVADEIAILSGRHESVDIDQLTPVLNLDQATEMVSEASTIYAAEPVLNYIVGLSTATRSHEEISLGVSPRASIAILKAARVSAAVAGRNYVTPEDVRALIVPVFSHRVQLSSVGLQRRRSVADVLSAVVASVPVPRPVAK